MLKKTPAILMVLYDLDLLEEEEVVKWHAHAPGERDEAGRKVREAAEPFIKWLREAEAESGEEDRQPLGLGLGLGLANPNRTQVRERPHDRHTPTPTPTPNQVRSTGAIWSRPSARVAPRNPRRNPSYYYASCFLYLLHAPPPRPGDCWLRCVGPRFFHDVE